MQNLILIKLGGSLITDKSKPYTPRPKTIALLGKEIKKAISNSPGLKLVIVHGSGSFGHTSAAKYQVTEGFSSDQNRWGTCLTHHDARQINQIVIDQLLKVGLSVAAVSPSSILIAKNKQIKKSFFDQLVVLLEKGIIPILFGDVIWDKSQGACIYSGEMILNLLTRYLTKKSFSIKKAIFCGTEDGVYRLSDKKTIPLITPANFATIKKNLQTSQGVDVTGGMLHKVGEALNLVSFRLRSFNY